MLWFVDCDVQAAEVKGHVPRLEEHVVSVVGDQRDLHTDADVLHRECLHAAQTLLQLIL